MAIKYAASGLTLMSSFGPQPVIPRIQVDDRGAAKHDIPVQLANGRNAA